MSFNKITTFNTQVDDFEIIDNELIKTASVKLPDGIDYDPDYLYMRVKAVSAGEVWGANKNNDYFPEAELLKNYKTFLAAHVFKNHENKKIEAAIGDVLTAEWSDRMKCVYLLIRVDKKIAPSIVRGFEKGFMTDVSMGCRVDHVVCSYCGQKAKTRLDYCEHLKTMKGKIMENGKKVYEINIAPKFHDISVVLNGAERTAKAERIYDNLEKTASEIIEAGAFKLNVVDALADFTTNNNLSKTASFMDSDMEVIASVLNNKTELPDAQKIAEFKKELQGKIENLAAKDVAKDGLENFGRISEMLKLLYTKYWDKEKCTKIANTLKDIAKENRTSVEVTFDQFLKVTDFAGIELSPLEIHDIYHEIADVDTYDARKINLAKEISPESLSEFGKISDQFVPSGNMLSVLGKCRTLVDGYDELTPKFDNEMPALKAKIVLSSHGKYSGIDDSILASVMERILKPELCDRSSHRQFLVPRLRMISEGAIRPNAVLGATHHLPVGFLKSKSLGVRPSFSLPLIVAGILNSKYQDDRVKRFNSGELEVGLKKVASYLDSDLLFKTASSRKPKIKISAGRPKDIKITPTKAALAGIPLTYAYSALQRSRINNGEDISSLNRYVAENPGNAALIQTALTKNGLNYLIPVAKDIPSQAHKVKDLDIFKSASIDTELLSSGYNENDITILKYACVMNGIGKEDIAEDMLNANNLSFDDVSQYLKTAKQCYTIELEKTAGTIKDISMSVLGDMVLDNPKKTSMAAAMPGYLFDGIALAAIGKGLQNASKNNGKGVQR